MLFFTYILQSKDFPLGSLTEGKKTIYHRNGRREKWKTPFILPDVKSKELLRIIFSMYAFFYIYFAIERFSSEIFNQRKENYLSNRRRMEDALYFILPNVKSKELLRTIFSMFVFFFAYIHTIERFSSGIFNRRKENYLSSKQKKNGRRPLLYLTRCKI